MPRKRLTEVMEKEIKENVANEKGIFIVVYDFHKKKIPKEFYQRITEIAEKGYAGDRIQKSVYICYDLHSAVFLAELGKYHGADVKVYKIEKEITI